MMSESTAKRLVSVIWKTAALVAGLVLILELVAFTSIWHRTVRSGPAVISAESQEVAYELRDLLDEAYPGGNVGPPKPLEDGFRSQTRYVAGIDTNITGKCTFDVSLNGSSVQFIVWWHLKDTDLFFVIDKVKRADASGLVLIYPEASAK